MSEIVTAIYENGLLRPLRPLMLREHQTVRLQVLPEESAGDSGQVVEALAAAGILTPPPGHPDVAPISEEELHELAETLGRTSGKPLSEIIIEERGER
jgi:predicted DNA-binding antitoxin AbrB/MazE fold protein